MSDETSSLGGDRRVVDQEHRDFVRSSLTCIEKKLTHLNNDILVVKTVLSNDHPRDLAREIEAVKLDIQENKNTNKNLASKIAAIATGMSTAVVLAFNYITKHHI